MIPYGGGSCESCVFLGGGQDFRQACKYILVKRHGKEKETPLAFVAYIINVPVSAEASV